MVLKKREGELSPSLAQATSFLTAPVPSMWELNCPRFTPVFPLPSPLCLQASVAPCSHVDMAGGALTNWPQCTLQPSASPLRFPSVAGSPSYTTWCCLMLSHS